MKWIAALLVYMALFSLLPAVVMWLLVSILGGSEGLAWWIAGLVWGGNFAWRVAAVHHHATRPRRRGMPR